LLQPEPTQAQLSRPTKYCNPTIYYCPSNTTYVPWDYPLIPRPRQQPQPRCTGSILDPIECEHWQVPELR
jgi:hypothetical protein